MVPKFVYYSPGDSAQKVIPGGAKTNENFWKFQNDINKSSLRFPSFLLVVFDYIFFWDLGISEAPVLFRASGDNFLRSITRAIVNKNIGKP